MLDHNKVGPLFSPTHWRLGRGPVLIGLAAMTMVLLWAANWVADERVTSALQYRRSGILAGEYWRLVTGHLVHAGFRHMALNVAGGLVMAGLFVRTYTLQQWFWIVLAGLVVIDIGFLWRETDLESYVGFSGVLHGVLAAGMCAWWRTESRAMALALTVITVGKLAWEQYQGPVTLAGDDLRVIVNSHLYGAIGGGLVGAALVACRKLPNRESKPDRS